ncbi:MAG: hypothetical protein R3C60_10745 [Parvularculaceae bacterium]
MRGVISMIAALLFMILGAAYLVWRKNKHDKAILLAKLYTSALEGNRRMAIDASLQRLGIVIDGAGYDADDFCAHAAAAVLAQNLNIKPTTDDELYAGGILIMALVDVISRRHCSDFESAACLAPIIWCHEYLDAVKSPDGAGEFVASLIETYNSLVSSNPRVIESLGVYFSNLLDGTLSEEDRGKIFGLHQALCENLT